MTILCLDPSIRALGWAVFVIGGETPKLTAYNVKKLNLEGESWIVRAKVMLEVVKDLENEYCPAHIYIETPSHYSAGKGEVARNSGAILKLMFLVGAVYGAFKDQVTLLPVSRWKGNVPKEITQRRMLKRWNATGDHNAIDAVGIGDYVISQKLYASARS